MEVLSLGAEWSEIALGFFTAGELPATIAIAGLGWSIELGWLSIAWIRKGVAT